MRWRINDRELLLRYLAGELSRRETERLDERLLSNDDFLDRMEDAWNDLVDASVAGELSQEQRARLEKILRQALAERRLLPLARAFKKEHPPGAAQAQAVAKSPGRGFLWRAAAAVICAAVVIGVVLYMKNAQHPKNLPGATAAMRSTNAPGEGAPSFRSRQPPLRAPSRQPAFALLLGTGVERGMSSSRAVTLPHGLKTIEVQILLPPQESSEQYYVQVVFPHHSAVKTVSGLIPEDVFSQKLVRFDLPALELPSGLYTFRLYRERRAQRTLVASYHEVIAREPRRTAK